MESFEELAVQYQPMIYKIIRSLSLYKNKDEFYQIGLIALWDASKAFDANKGNFTNYAYTFIKGRILTDLNKTKKLEERNIYPEEEFWEMIPNSEQENPMEELLLESHCHTLTPHQRKWLYYTCVDQLTVKEIAEKERVSISAVKNWRAGARKRLEECKEN
ncbi:sigma-70 family RNA polymerase sigma factor [Neobacillus sp. D3-1R]|uniref:sigma-70 family RNA polymerase sigma factor n=1 Tax=Neobacillus sp. D3-1R TaxID=3445778 RepID=UPI003FA15C07